MKLVACSEDATVMHQVLDLLEDGVIVIDRDGRIDFVNEALAVALGYRREQLVGRLYLEVLDQGSMDLAMEGLERALNLPITPNLTVTMRASSGQRHSLTFEGMGIRTAERGVVGVCCVTHDLPSPPARLE
jgi:PAS domain S-box-containing protein